MISEVIFSLASASTATSVAAMAAGQGCRPHRRGVAYGGCDGQRDHFRGLPLRRLWINLQLHHFVLHRVA